jgi:hypothetical protein
MPRSSLPLATRELSLFRERGLGGWLEMPPAQPEAAALPADRLAPALPGDLFPAPLVMAPAGTGPITLLLSSMLTYCLGATP